MRLVVEVILEDLLRAIRVALLGIKSGTRVVGNHAVSTTERVLHVAPWVVLGRRLLVPDVTSIATELSALDGGSNILSVANGSTSRVH